MQVQLIFLTAVGFMRRYLLRADFDLVMTLAMTVLQTFAQLLAFALIVGGLRAAVSGTDITFMRYHFSIFPHATSAIVTGIALLGISTLMEMARILFSIRTATSFGLKVINKLEHSWDDLGIKRKRYAFRLAGLATSLSRLGANALTPLTTFAAGAVALAFIEPVLAVMVLVVGAAAIFAFVPTNMLEERDTKENFDPVVSREEIADNHLKIKAALAVRLRNYRSKRFIRSINMLVFFVVLALLATFVDINWAVDRYAEAVVVIIVVARGSITSLVRVALMMRIVSQNLSALAKMFEVLKTGELTGTTELTDTNDDEE